ncbi:MAG: hypothetical protein U0Z44_10515 [Kouleothrix sp.]
MAETPIVDIHQLVQDGRAAALAGDTLAARSSFRRATELDPNSAEAWVGLSGVAPILAEKREYLLKALALQPDNADAAASLRYVEQLIGQGMQLEPSRRRAERNASGDASPLLGAPEPAATATAVEFCYRHPDRETALRCIQCDRPICGACAQMTSVGQLCPECRRDRRPSNYKVAPRDLVIAAVVALIAAALVAVPVAFFARGFFGFFIVFMAGPAIAEFIVRIVDRFSRLKRGRPMQITVGVAMALGTLPMILFNPLLIIIYMVVSISTAVARLR